MKALATILLGTSILFSAGAAMAADLHGDVDVNADTIHLGDLFDALGPNQATIVIGQAPAPGHRITYDATVLDRIAAANGVDWKSTGNERVIVSRPSVDVTADQIQAAFTKALADAGAPAGMEVQLDNPGTVLRLPANSDSSIGFANVNYDAARGRATGDLVIPAKGEPVIRQSFGARVAVMVTLPVLNRRVAPGETIAASDVEWTKVPRTRISGDVVTEARDLIGLTVRHGASPYQPVRADEVRAPVVVTRGALVTMMLQSGNMILTVQGRAQTEGGVNEIIRVTNTASNRTIDARVAGPDLVMVQPTAQAPLGQFNTTTARATRTALN
ncbi:flagella basal body P-ring formation protein FlgA [Nitrospirillum amazonense]|uniref:Flagella basal body P-ring formation protein FlgA n=1 Tax=Nitrospirillum amazonense TaxID=28077 RepID=A0A560F523_9PROT|nr:flagellar basal body P-ring formation chaperone FlgA [Nitrospirillum amazonense]TWB16742.1 flagella basal body P-ring formation protein FlgA [Nitrospirillum amazonense]